MLPHVDTNNQKQLAIWVALLFGFFLFHRKSNLVPDARVHDAIHQLSRRDIKINGSIMRVNIKWSKTIQFSQRKLQIPVVQDTNSPVCPVFWLLHMVQAIPASGSHNLFSFQQNGVVLPVTYRDLTIQMRKWLELIGVSNATSFSSHSLCRGGTTHAFENNVPEQTIQLLGDWVSQSFCRYIDLTVKTRLKAWFLISR